MINISRLKEACVWLCQGEEYRVYYENLIIKITITSDYLYKISLITQNSEGSNTIQFIVFQGEMDYFSIILEEKLLELAEFIS